MTDYDLWLKHHCTVFGIYEPAHVRTVKSWEPIFTAAGWLLPDLFLCTDWLAMHAPPRFLGDHLAALRNRMTELKAVSLRELDADPAYSACVKCDGTGRLIVPHLLGIIGDEWRPVRGATPTPQYYTCAVRCDCSRGRFGNFTGRGANGDIPLMTLAEYERANPHWHRQLARRAAMHREEARLDVDDTWRETVAKLTRHLRVPGDDE